MNLNLLCSYFLTFRVDFNSFNIATNCSCDKYMHNLTLSQHWDVLMNLSLLCWFLHFALILHIQVPALTQNVKSTPYVNIPIILYIIPF